MHCSYGIVTITVPDGRKVYFKREVGFLDHDVWVISPSADLCNIPNEDTDYRFPTLDPRILYRIEGNSLLLYVGNAAVAPKSGSFPIDIVQKEVDPLEYLEMAKRLGDLSLTRMQIPIDENLKCRH